MKQEFSIKGMHCTSCKMLIEDVVADMSGVTKCTVDVKGEKMVVEGTFSSSAVIAKVQGLGKYKVAKMK